MDLIFYLIKALWQLVTDAFYWIGQTIIDTITLFLSMINFCVPTIPAFPSEVIEHLTTILTAVNWILPYGFLISCIEIIIASTVCYFTAGVLLRWVKVVS